MPGQPIWVLLTAVVLAVQPPWSTGLRTTYRPGRQTVGVVVAMANPWVGLVVAATMLPLIAGIVVVRIQNWRARKPGSVSGLIPACYYVLMIIGAAIWGYFQAVGTAIVAVALLGMLTRSVIGVVAITQQRRRRHARDAR